MQDTQVLYMEVEYGGVSLVPHLGDCTKLETTSESYKRAKWKCKENSH